MPQGNNPAFTNDGRRIDWSPNTTGQPAQGYDVHFTQLTDADIPAPVVAAPEPAPEPAPAPVDAPVAQPAANAGDMVSVTKASTARWDNHQVIHVPVGTTVNEAIAQYRATGTQLEATVNGALDTGVYVGPDYQLQAGDALIIQPVHKSQSH